MEGTCRYVYCSKEAGCAQGSDITPYRLCVMKYQVNLNAFSYPPAISRSNITNFTSGTLSDSCVPGQSGNKSCSADSLMWVNSTEVISCWGHLNVGQTFRV